MKLLAGVGVLVCSGMLTACDGKGATHVGAEYAAAPLTKLSLLGVRTEMTPEELNTAFPGAHCAPAAERFVCRVPNSAMGAGDIDVTFQGGRVTDAITRGEIGSGRIAADLVRKDLGLPHKPERFVDGEIWVAEDGSELRVSQGGALGRPYIFEIELTTAAERARREEESERQKEEAIAAMASTVGRVVTVDTSGRISVCGLQLGQTFRGQVGCQPTTKHKNPSSLDALLTGCHLRSDFQQTKGPSRYFFKDACVIVRVDAATRSIQGVTAGVRAKTGSWGVLFNGVQSIENGDALKRKTGFGLDSVSIPLRVAFTNDLGDELTVMDQDTGQTAALAFQDPESKQGSELADAALTVSLNGTSITEATFQ